MALSALLLDKLGTPGDPPHSPLHAALEAQLAGGIAEAQRRWPGVEADPEGYLGWIAQRVADEAGSLEAVEAAVGRLRLPDLYLACACASGDPRALAAFDAAFVAGDRRNSDDVKQALRVKLFVGPAPRITSYAGRGDLGRWVRAVAARLAIDEARGSFEVPAEDALLEAIGIDPSHGPAHQLLKQDAREILQTAVREAIGALSARERTMLLQHYIDRVGVVELGKLFGLAPSNVSRNLAKARIVLVSQIRRSVMRHRKLGGDELDSLVDLVRSQLSLTGGLRA
ncbi:MAG: hypothetical protein ACTHU0_25040 [Kofleriaceae bacterium]